MRNIEIRSRKQEPLMNPGKFDRLINWQEQLVERSALPCAATHVIHGGQTQVLETTGWSDVATQKPLATNSLFRLHSMTKPIISVALMLLYEEGRFQLNDPAHWYLGEKWRQENMNVFAGWSGDDGRRRLDYKTVPCANDIQIVHLLTHTSGLSYGFDPSGRGIPIDRVYAKTFNDPSRKKVPGTADDPSMLRAFCDNLAEMPLLYQPGTQWNYSYATDVCARLIEVLSGLCIDEFLQRRVFSPLGMVDTTFDVKPGDAARLVTSYRYVPPKEGTTFSVIGSDDALLFPHTGSFEGYDDPGRDWLVSNHRPKYLSGGGGLVGTIGDYSAFCQMILRGGLNADGDRVIGRKTLQFIGSNHLPGDKTLMDMVPFPEFQYSETAKNGGGFGLGFSIVKSPQEAGLIGSVGNMAWGGAASTIFWIDPAEDLSVVFFTQVLGMRPLNALRAKLGSLIYSDLN